MNEYNVGDLISDFLFENDLKTVFGVVSVHNIPILDAIAKRNLIKIPLKEILESKDRNNAGTTVNPRGLIFLGPSYENITKLKPEKSPLI